MQRKQPIAPWSCLDLSAASKPTAGKLTTSLASEGEAVWAGPYQPCVSKEGFAFLMNAVVQEMPCGCKAIGNGTLPHPLSVQLCPMHAAAPDACKVLLEAIEDIRQMAEGRSRVNMADGTSLASFCRSAFVKSKAADDTISRLQNSHEALLSNLQYIDSVAPTDQQEDGEYFAITITGKALKDIRAAIARAEGETNAGCDRCGVNDRAPSNKFYCAECAAELEAERENYAKAKGRP